MKLTAEEIEAGKSEAGGFTKETLLGWGIEYPPPKGWKEMLMAGEVFQPYVPEPVTELEEQWARGLCEEMQLEPNEIIGAPALPRWRSFISYARWSINVSNKLPA